MNVLQQGQGAFEVVVAIREVFARLDRAGYAVPGATRRAVSVGFLEQQRPTEDEQSDKRREELHVPKISSST